MPSPGSTLTEVLTEVLPIRPLFAFYLSSSNPRGLTAWPTGRRGKPRLYGKLPALKTVLVNDHADPTPATIRKTAHYSPTTIDLHVGFGAHDIGGERKRKVDC